MQLDANAKFMHRPISVNVDEVMEMEAVRTLPAAETMVVLNLRFNRRTARALAKLLIEKLLVNDAETVDLVTFSLQGKLK